MNFIEKFKRGWNSMNAEDSESVNNTKNIQTRELIPNEDVQFNMIPHFDYNDDEVVNKFLSTVCDNQKFMPDDEYEIQVEKIIDNFYNNFYELKMDNFSVINPETNMSFWIANELWGLSLHTGIEDLGEIKFSKKQAARAWFLKGELKKLNKKRAIEKLNKSIGLSAVSMTTVYSKTAGIINIKQDEVLNSLKQTHPEYFV